MSTTSSPWRVRLEQSCRFAAISLLSVAALVARSSSCPAHTPATPSVFTIATPDTLRALRDLVVRAETSERDTLLLAMRTMPSSTVRAALGTLHRFSMAGALSWQDRTTTRGAALSVEADGGPQGGMQLRLAVPDSSGLLVVRDGASVLDSVGAVTARTDRARQWQLASAGRELTVQLSGARLSGRTVPAPTDSVRRVLVIASPGWESKFVIAALEERGWRVDARLSVTPKASVTVGAPVSPDPARHAVVVVLDSIEVPPVLSTYLRRGGGVVFSGDGVRSAVARSMMSMAGATRVAAIPGALLTAEPLDGLERWRFEARDAVPLVRTAGTAPVVAMRVGAGRAIASGYRNTWHWRMMGTDAGRADHAAWWSDLVESAMASDRVPTDDADPAPGDPAPFADLVAQLGASDDAMGLTTRPVAGGEAQRAVRWGTGSASWLPWLVGLALGALLVEWGSRRLRGEP